MAADNRLLRSTRTSRGSVAEKKEKKDTKVTPINSINSSPIRLVIDRNPILYLRPEPEPKTGIESAKRKLNRKKT